MSRQTISKILTTPAAQTAGLSLTSSVTVGTFGAWVEAIAVTSGTVQVAGLQFNPIGVGSQAGRCEIQIGVGALGVEDPIASYVWDGFYTNAHPLLYLFNPAVNLVPAGARVSLRVRSFAASLGALEATLQYYVAGLSDTDQNTYGEMSYFPYASAGAVVTPNAVAWANSAWVEAKDSLVSDINLAAVLPGLEGVDTGYDMEIDVATGAAAAETLITTVRVAKSSVEASPMLWLPGAYFLAAGTRLSVRLRKGNTNVVPRTISLLYYGVEPECPTVDAGDDQSLVYPATATLTGSVTGGAGCPDAATYAWTQTSGPDTADILSPTAITTDVEFPVAGVYVFQFAATTCVCTATASVTLTVTAAEPSPPDPDEPNRTMRRMRRAPHLSNEGNRITFDRFQLDLEAGLGIATGQGEDPQIMLRWSDDGGQTWGPERWTSAGPQGAYRTRAIWRRLGQARDRVFEVTFTDPVPWRLIAAWIDVRMGRN